LEVEKKKKLCLVIPSLQAGGMERVMSELATYFATKSDLEIHLVLYGITREIFYSVPESIIIHKPPFRFNNRWRLYYTVKTLFYLRREIKKVNPVSILSFGEIWNSFVLMALSGLGYHVFISDRCSPERTYNLFNTSLRKIFYPRAAGIIAQTAKAREIYSSEIKNKNIRVIGNPIREIRVSDEPEKQNIVLMVGRLIESKHQDKLIEMFARVSPPDWKLMLVGYDHLKQQNMARLKTLARDLDVDSRVIFMGKMDNIEEIYLKSSVFAFTSSSEGFPNAIGEAMAAGLPVVAFDCVAGPAEMIKDGHNGFLVPLFDYELFQEKLEVLMTDKDRRKIFGKNAGMDILIFSINQIGEQYLQFILDNKQ
jgi:GalNAc-alpha-(1->4)-GalNAc-alpha-(1->3)-diNAcBac-PP-undecaprenol alpha-1,4-N-acetyl-D-galactosaminyltransferase